VEDEIEEEEEEESTPEDFMVGPMATIMTGRACGYTKGMLVEAIPERGVSEKLLWHWFQSETPMLREYFVRNAGWADRRSCCASDDVS
jgi:hypothetical protein